MWDFLQHHAMHSLLLGVGFRTFVTDKNASITRLRSDRQTGRTALLFPSTGFDSVLSSAMMSYMLRARTFNVVSLEQDRCKSGESQASSCRSNKPNCIAGSVRIDIILRVFGVLKHRCCRRREDKRRTKHSVRLRR